MTIQSKIGDSNGNHDSVSVTRRIRVSSQLMRSGGEKKDDSKSGSDGDSDGDDSDGANKRIVKKLLDIEELAAVLNVPKSWIYQRTRLGQKGIPHYKMGKYVRFDLDAVLAFLSPLNSDDESEA